MTKELQRKTDAAVLAIRTVLNDRSDVPAENIAALETLLEEVREAIGALKA